MLTVVIKFAEQPEKATIVSVYKIELTLKKDKAILNEAPGIVEARYGIENIH